MTVDRLLRINELLKREIAAYLFRLVNRDGFDPSAVTVTRVETSKDLRHARVLISVREGAGNATKVLGTIKRQGKILQHHIGKHLTMKHIPHLSFHLDDSIHQGDHVLDILNRLERLDPSPDETHETPESDQPA